LPGNRGLGLLADIKKIHPLLPVLVLGQQARKNFTYEVMNAGGDGYWQKDSGLKEIVSTVRILVDGPPT